MNVFRVILKFNNVMLVKQLGVSETHSNLSCVCLHQGICGRNLIYFPALHNYLFATTFKCKGKNNQQLVINYQITISHVLLCFTWIIRFQLVLNRSIQITEESSFIVSLPYFWSRTANPVTD